MKRLLLSSIIVIISFTINGQNRLLYNHYVLNPETVNPGFMNIHNEISATLLYRIQYLSQPNFPQDGYLNASYHINKNNGIGFTVNNQNMNKFNNLEAGVNYVYHAWLSNYMALGLGASVNFYQQVFNPNSFVPRDYNDPVFDDPRSMMGVNFGVGASLQSKDLNVGVSFPRFFANAMTDQDSKWKTKYSNVYLNASYHIGFNKYFSLTPAFLVRTAGGVPTNIIADIYTGFLNDALIIGAGYNTGQSVHATVGYLFKFGLRISYNYETAPFGNMTGLGSSHELGIGFYSLFTKPGFDERKILKKNGKVKGMRTVKYKGSGE